MFSKDQLELFRIILDCSRKCRNDVYVVGGTIRDLFLGHDPADQDIDFIVVGDAIEFAAICREIVQGEVKKYSDFLTAKIVNFTGFSSIKEIDFASSRRETYAKPGKLPSVLPASIQEDLKRRDFTINAMAVPVRDLLDWGENSFGQIDRLLAFTMDLFGGYEDINNKLIRILHDASFIDDPTRLFRAARYASRIGGEIEPHSKRLYSEALEGGALETISRERKLNEIRKIVQENEVAGIVDFLYKNGLISIFTLYLPERHEQIMRTLKKLNTTKVIPADLIYEVVLRIFFDNSHYSIDDLPAAREKYALLGFGRREINRFAYDTQKMDDKTEARAIKQLSEAGLFFQLLNAGEEFRGTIEEVIKNRG